MAEGAVSFALEHYVSSRIATVTYGVHISLPYDANNRDHRSRKSDSFVDASGETRIRNFFKVLVSKVRRRFRLLNILTNYASKWKGKQFTEETPIRYPLWLHRKNTDELKTAWVELMVYRGSAPTPEWIDIGECLPPTRCWRTLNIIS